MKNKYGNKKIKTVFKGKQIVIDSKLELKRLNDLLLLERAGKISGLNIQPKFSLMSGFKIRTTKNKSGKASMSELSYVSDFIYLAQDGKCVVEDVKGHLTEVYRIKRKLFLNIADRAYNVSSFVEVYKNKTVSYDCTKIQ